MLVHVHLKFEYDGCGVAGLREKITIAHKQKFKQPNRVGERVRGFTNQMLPLNTPLKRITAMKTDIPLGHGKADLWPAQQVPL
jgi:hypothetical protein